MPSFQVPVLGSLFVSFRPSLIRLPQLFLRCFPYAFALGIFRFPSASFRPLPFCLRLLSLLLLPFRTSRLRLTVASPVRRFHSRFHGLPRSSQPGFPCLASGSRTRLPVCFLSPFPDSLPQLFLRCLPHAFAFGLSPSVPLSFVRFPSGSGYSASASSFPLLPCLASQLLFRCCLSAFRLPCSSTSVPPGFPCFPSIFKYSAFCLFPFILPSFAPTAVPLVLPFCFRFRAFPSLLLSFVRFRLVLTT